IPKKDCIPRYVDRHQISRTEGFTLPNQYKARGGFDMRKRFRSLLPMVVACLIMIAPGAMSFGQSSANENNLRAEIMNKALNKSQFKDVHVAVADGTVTLTGTVPVQDVKGVKAVNNQIEVGGPTVSDAELQEKVLKAVQYDRLGYHTTPFNAISVSVQNGVVTLGGSAYGPVDADSAVSTVANMRGVKGL